MPQRTQLRLGAMSGSFGTGGGAINDQEGAVATGSIDADGLDDILSHLASSVKRLHGNTSFSDNAVGTFYTDLLPSADDTHDLGSASAAWQDLHLEGDVLMTDAGKVSTAAGDLTIESAAAGVTLDAASTLKLDSDTGDISFEDGGTAQLAIDMDGTAGEIIMQLKVDSDDFVFKQFDGTEVFRVEDNGDFDVAGGAGDSGVTITAAGQITADGRILVDDATDATSTTDGSLQTDGGLSVAKDAVLGNDVKLLSDAAVLNFGADSDVNLTHVADTGLLLNSTRQLQFGDAGTYIHQSADGVLDLVSDTEIEINATTIDVNGSMEVSANVTIAGDLTVSGQTTTLDSVNTTLKDRIFAIASGSSPGDVDSGIVFTRSTADLGGGSDKKHGALLFDGASGNVFKVGVTNDNGESNTLTVADDDLGELYVGKLYLDGASNHIDVASSDVTITAAQDFVVDATRDIILDVDNADVMLKDGGTQFLKFTNNSGDAEVRNGAADKDIIFIEQGGNEIFRVDGGDEALKMASGKKIMLGAAEETISGDGTDITFEVGANGDINIPANIGLTFGDDGEKIEGNGTRLTISSGVGMFLDAEGTIILDADNGIFSFDDGGVNQGAIVASAGAFAIAAKNTMVLSSSQGVFQLQDDGASFGQLLNIGGNLALSSSLHNGDIEFHGNSGELIMKIDSSANSLLIDTARKIEFNDTGTFINSSEDGQLDLASDGTMADSILANAPNGGVKLNAGLDGNAAAIHLDSASGVTIAGGDQNDSVYIENSPLMLEGIVAPGSTTDKLYNVSGGLYWNGIRLDVSSATIAKSVFKMVNAVAAGSNISGDAGASAIDISTIARADQHKFIDVFVNGQLMMSGSATERTAGTADYHMIGTAAGGNDNAAEFQFAFDIEPEDVVVINVK